MLSAIDNGLSIFGQRTFPLSSTTITAAADGSLAITSTYCLIRGYGNSDDTITSITTTSDLIGKLIHLRAGGSEDITFTGSVINRSANVILNEDGDGLLLHCTAANTVYSVATPETTGD